RDPGGNRPATRLGGADGRRQRLRDVRRVRRALALPAVSHDQERRSRYRPLPMPADRRSPPGPHRGRKHTRSRNHFPRRIAAAVTTHEASSDAPAQPVAPSAGKTKLLIVEDEESIRSQMRWALAPDYEVFLAEDRASAIEVFGRERPAVVTLDLGLPPRPRDVEEGFLAMSAILDEDPRARVVIITGRGEKQHALRAIGQG